LARKIIIQREDGTWPVLTETLAKNEAQMQEILKDNPDLLPIDEFAMTGPLLVVGRETSLPSGYVDLLCLARGGEILIIEFKTGPQNADFRHALAQMLDYGSDLWQMTYEEFENAVAVRFFTGAHCQDKRIKGQTTLATAARAIWPDQTEEEFATFRDKLSTQLIAGAFHYLIVAQRFTPTMERAIGYMNATMQNARFYAIELVRFAAVDLAAFESRTILKPDSQSNTSKAIASTNETLFLEGIVDNNYREILKHILDASTGLGLKLDWGTNGPSIRVQTPDRKEPLTIAWLYPPKVSGWNGLLDLSLGYDPNSAVATPSAQTALKNYVATVESLSGIEPVKPTRLRAFHLKPEIVTNHQYTLAEIFAELVRQIGAAG